MRPRRVSLAGFEKPPIRTLRLVVLTAVGSLLAFLAVLLVMGLRPHQPTSGWVVAPLLLGLADVVLVPAVGSTLRPLRAGVTEADARRVSLGVLNTVTLLRFAFAEAPALFGLVAALVSHNLLPYVVGLAFAAPLLLLFVYPRRAVVDGVRDRLEAGGVASHLWEAVSGERAPERG
jgi:hypothetical protein